MKISLEEFVYASTSREIKPSKATKEMVLPFFVGQGIRKVLDYGCGRFLRDSVYLAENSLIVDAIDLPEQLGRINPLLIQKIQNLSDAPVQSDYDAVLLNFVLQVLPFENQREEVLNKAISLVKSGGYLVLSLRNKSEIKCNFAKKKGIPYNDGFVIQNGIHKTFVRGYTKKEMEEIILNHNLKIIQFSRTYASFVSINRKS